MDMGMDIHILPKERLALLKGLIATATIVNVKKDMYIVVDMAKEDTVRLFILKFWSIQFSFLNVFFLENGEPCNIHNFYLFYILSKVLIFGF